METKFDPKTARKVLSEIADVAGIGCIVGAIGSWNLAVAVAVLGLVLLAVGWVADR